MIASPDTPSGVVTRAGAGTIEVMESHISAAEAAETFPDVIERVRLHRDVFVVEREGEPICRIEPIQAERSTVRDLLRLLNATPRPDDDYLDAVEEVTRNQPECSETPWES